MFSKVKLVAWTWIVVLFALSINLEVLSQVFTQRPCGSIETKFNASLLSLRVNNYLRNGKPEDREDYVKSLMEMCGNELKTTPYSVLVYNMNQAYVEAFYDLQAHIQVEEFGTTWGIWVFRCGTFMNQGSLGYSQWAYGGRFGFVFHNTYGVVFTEPDCPNISYRPKQFVRFPYREYHERVIRVFSDVESNAECEAWTLEIDGNAAVYEPDTLKCQVKKTNIGGGQIFLGDGSFLGNYDAFLHEVDSSTEKTAIEKWAAIENKCDIIHLYANRNDKYCRKFPVHHNHTVLIRRRG